MVASIKRYAGEADSTLDDKNRLTIPKKFRRQLLGETDGDGQMVWLLPGYKGSEFMITDDAAGIELANKLSRNVGGGAESRAKVLLGLSERVEIDRAGRVLVPASFLKNCRVVEREFALVGKGAQIEVYAASKWRSLTQAMTQDDIDGMWEAVNGTDEGESLVSE